MKTILVPVDFSKYSEYALEVAASIAKTQNAGIIVLHMLEFSKSIFNRNELQKVWNEVYFKKLVNEKLNAFLNKIYLKDIKVTSVIKKDKTFNKLNTLIKDHKIDLIVMGSQGASGFKEIFIGSNTEKVVRSSNVPVLVIKNRIKDFEINKAVIVYDFHLEGIETFKYALKFLQQFKCKLKLLYINLIENYLSSLDMKARIDEFFKKANLENLELKKDVIYYNDYSLEKGIFNYATGTKADVVIILTHGYKGFAYYFYGSVGKEVANHLTIPVMTINMKT